MTRRAIFRFDAGPRIGAGHAVRCIALAQALAREGWRCAFAVNEGCGRALPFVAAPEAEFAEAAPRQPWSKAALVSRWPEGCELAVVDHYGLDAGFEREIAGWAQRVLVIDDLLDRGHDCDFLLCPAPPKKAAADPAGAKRRLFGPDHALLRDQFGRARDVRLLAKPANKERLRVHVALGGTSRVALARRILEGLALTGAALDVTLVGDVGEAAGPMGPNVKVETVAAAADMAAQMARADIGIGACGGGAWERAVLGLPSLALVLADNQIHVARAVEKAQAAAVIDDAAGIGAREICDCVRPLVENKDRREAMARRAALLCDGLGARRALLAIDPERDRRGLEIVLRRAAPGDREAVFEWQRHPDTRRYANNPEPPSWEEHRAWFGERLTEPQTQLLIIESGGEAAGVLRLDLMRREGQPERLVSIAVAPEMKQRGIALAALRAARRLLPGGSFIADVHPDNAASRALFERAGFARHGERTFILADQSGEPAGREREGVA